MTDPVFYTSMSAAALAAIVVLVLLRDERNKHALGVA